VRQRIYVGHDNRCLDNVPRLKKKIPLRDEAARLLGYPNHAECQLEEKMAESTDFVNAFLKDIKEKLTPIAKLKLDALLNLKRAHIESTKSTDASVVGLRRLEHFVSGISATTVTSPKYGRILLTRRSSRNTPP
jgi:Zn-dependent oligopeptidase